MTEEAEVSGESGQNRTLSKVFQTVLALSTEQAESTLLEAPRTEKPVKEKEVVDADQASNVSQDPLEKDNDQGTEASSNEDDSTNTSEKG